MMYEYTTRHGLRVRSTVPFPDERWWDKKSLHIFWSYFSWFSLFMEALGWHAPRNFFKRHLQRKDYSKS